ncbi:MAG: zinc-ribbon domain-containing protein [Candidatus Lokiarchaeota archaeon]|nr:zinc-ribbon domain-containing protein [Candidatus Lokiarchaeota archaeon]MBD3201290.1 zinc-ribbon domain-containing protein [Candidatus Lokiarchaeota archaeon]
MGRDQIKSSWEKYLSGQTEATPSPQASGEGKVCEKCGKQNLASSNFCVECGENLQ